MNKNERLKHLHKEYDNRQQCVQTEWMYCYNELPPKNKPVLCWVNGIGRDLFGVNLIYKELYPGEYYWYTYPGYHLYSQDVIAWKDL